MSKVGLIMIPLPVYYYLLLPRDDGSAVLQIKLKKNLRLLGAKGPSSLQDNAAY